ncbi:MAG: hemerythrin domain-containing protein [Chromatiales bacterium]|nr:hemerythrin domain-containing protein [Chromatiales bacterium]
MLNLTAQTTIRELQEGPPALMQVLSSTGIFRDGDDASLTIGQLCLSWGLNPGILLMMLRPANVVKAAPPLDIGPFLRMPLPDFVTHIEEVYHAGLRGQLPRLQALTAEAAGAAPDDPRLAELRDGVGQLAEELIAHLAHEEEALFPMIRGLAAGTVVATRCGSAVGGPIACMENDHALAERALLRFRELTDDYSAPSGAGAMLDLLREFDRDLREHMYKENEALFPRAVEAQREAAQRQQAGAVPSRPAQFA